MLEVWLYFSLEPKKYLSSCCWCSGTAST